MEKMIICRIGGMNGIDTVKGIREFMVRAEMDKHEGI